MRSISSTALNHSRSHGDQPMKIEADRDICIGAGMCVMATEAVFDQDDAGIVVVRADKEGQLPQDERQQVHMAVRQCPSGALSVVDD